MKQNQTYFYTLKDDGKKMQKPVTIKENLIISCRKL